MREEILHIGKRCYNAKAADLENVFKDTLLCILIIIKILWHFTASKIGT